MKQLSDPVFALLPQSIRKEILAAYGVPPNLIGNPTDSYTSTMVELQLLPWGKDKTL